MNAIDRRSLFLPLMGGLVALTWVFLWVWEQSPFGRYLNHGRWGQIGLAASICAAFPLGEVFVPLFLYAGGWLLMTMAMMLPTALTLLEMFRRLARERPDRGQLVALVIVGYLAVWGGFGVLAHGVDRLLYFVAQDSAFLTFNGWVLGAGVLIGAGLFQFSSLKYRCLDKCRMPMSFVVQYWRGQNQHYYSLMLGIHHGIFCVGCCWALMMLMFVVGTGNIGWMLALGLVMAAEKNLPWGPRLSTPLGIEPNGVGRMGSGK
jgi:predicted metal-binding membrane protein